ncbi:MAG: TIGR02453 family protein [Clostridiales bacterium]|nr:MAG: TIGR02453 family protein [Clostridiales bacterium]
MTITKQMLPFLANNRMKNSKQWYSDHKDEYKKHVYTPLADITRALAPTVAKIDSLIVTEPRYVISRIYRDTRFSKDKSTLYRDNMWLTFKRPSARWSCSPAFYFEIMQNGWRYGMGYYCATSQTMALYRNYISQYPDDFRKIIKPLKNLYSETEQYKRKPKGECPDDLLEWFVSKSVHVTKWENDIDKLFQEDYLEDIKTGFLQAAPLYNFLMELGNTSIPESESYIPKNNVEFEW